MWINRLQLHTTLLLNPNNFGQYYQYLDHFCMFHTTFWCISGEIFHTTLLFHALVCTIEESTSWATVYNFYSILDCKLILKLSYNYLQSVADHANERSHSADRYVPTMVSTKIFWIWLISMLPVGDRGPGVWEMFWALPPTIHAVIPCGTDLLSACCLIELVKMNSHFTKSTKYYRVTTFWEMLGLLKCWDSHFWGHLLRNAGILDFPPKICNVKKKKLVVWNLWRTTLQYP